MSNKCDTCLSETLNYYGPPKCTECKDFDEWEQCPIAKLQAENARLREALGRIADGEFYEYKDTMKIAREALEGSK